MRILVLAPLLALLLAAPAAADELSPPEEKALKTVERELLKLAKFAARGKDFEAAAAELRAGIAVCPQPEKLEKELAKVEKKAAKGRGKIKDSFPAKLAEKRSEAHLAVSLALADAALAVEKEHPQRYERWVGAIQTHFPTQEALDALDLVYFAPYLRWVSGTEHETLEAGGELHEGKWLDANAVAGLNRRHADWSDPWVIRDGVHEVRTTVALRQAKRILALVGAYREYFLRRFGGAWDLQPPQGLLPIIVTETQNDLRAQMQAITGGRAAGGPINGAAYYLQTNGRLNPCFVTYEPTDAAGTLFKIERFEQLLIPLTHEVTHQIAFEYSKHDYVATRQIQHHFWSVEAIANFMGYHVFDGKGWALTHPRMIPMGQGYVEGPFAHCKQNASSLPRLADFIAYSQQQFMTVNNYHIAATLAYFLLEGEGGKYRASFIKLLERVHKVRDEADSFAACFPGVDMNAMQAEWQRFLSGIPLDD